MGWNTEFAFIRAPEGTSLEQLVPDVFEPTDRILCFDAAKSELGEKDLCAAWLPGWAVIADCYCRLSEATSYLEEVSSRGETFVVRVAGNPIEVHYRRGKKVWKHNGIEAVLRALGRKMPKDDDEYVDGEDVAFEIIRKRTGIDFPDAIMEVDFTFYVLPL
jgi:hypothetical protein